MTPEPPNRGEFDDVDEFYRRVSAQGKDGPSESVRHAILEHAARLAEERKAGSEERGRVVNISAAKRRPSRPTWWRPVAFSTLAAASLAGLLIAPQFLPLRGAKHSETAAITVRQPAPAAPAPNEPAPAESASPLAEQFAPLNNAPAPERNLAKTQIAPAAPSKGTSQDELQAEGAQRTAGAAADSAMASAPAAAPAPQSTTRMSAARLLDPAAELRHAAGSGDMTALRAALERQPVIDARDSSGRTALLLAVLHGHGEAVDALLAAGADPNAVDAGGLAPLQAALDGQQAEIAAALRRVGAK
jgi:Ankyrin repeats (many copies)